MDRQAFEHLYLHANSIATLAFLRAMARIIAMPAPTEPSPAMQEFAAAIEHQMQHPETFDWSIYDGIDADYEVMMKQREEAEASALPFFGDCVAMSEEDEAEGAMPDVGRFLQRARAAAGPLAPRIADSFARVDHAALSAALATLPDDLPPLTTALSPADLERWIVLYEAEHPGLQRAVEETRKPEPVL
jgi:phosphoglycolate phosphatase-like HAD superfamily hydrolase